VHRERLMGKEIGRRLLRNLAWCAAFCVGTACLSVMAEYQQLERQSMTNERILDHLQRNDHSDDSGVIFTH